ncbi:hypothetical protein LXM94_23415 [Rhizobium sp. TRM95111]|uniref:hypothetical protein n=1 Tax=Rhizobium alarense TaxID=2846851 RepID=UPI001F1A3AEC|nr:hypothetical protein [Rhizobium alarense]MCF3642919.1 hypothetical protein [Rhizobium alarense]
MSLLADIYRSQRTIVESAQAHANRILADTSITGAPRALGVAKGLPPSHPATATAPGLSSQVIATLERERVEAHAAQSTTAPPARASVSPSEFWRGMHASVWDKRRGGKEARVEKPWDRVSVRGDEPQRPQSQASASPRADFFGALATDTYARRNAAALAGAHPPPLRDRTPL